MPQKSKNIILGFSGGIDSTYALRFLSMENKVTTCTFFISQEENQEVQMLKNKIISLTKHFTVDNIFVNMSDKFHRIVIKDFISKYIHGFTPNPCVICNRKIKFHLLYSQALIHNYAHIATGHYAKIEFQNGRYFIQQHNDKIKDQSYMLWMLPQKYLSKLILPLSHVPTKQDVRDIIQNEITHYDINTPESQDICFIPNGDIKSFFKTHYNKPIPHGDIILDGKKVGTHKGLPFYTIGQRKGLNVALGYPVFVKEIDSVKNQIIVCREKELNNDSMLVTNVNFQKYKTICNGFKCATMIRYHGYKYPCTLNWHNDKIIHVQFKHPVKAIAKGQSAVFYEENDIVGGGIII